MIRDIFISCSWQVFFFFLVTVNAARYKIRKYLSSGVCPLSTFFDLVTMEKANINYSYKNIPIPDRHQYKLVLLRRIESFIKNMRWNFFFFVTRKMIILFVRS